LSYRNDPVFVNTFIHHYKIPNTFSKTSEWFKCWLVLLFAIFSNHCLAALDLGAGVEQPFDYLIVQNCQAVQSMRRSMIGHWRTTWSTVCSFAPHSLAAEKGIPYLYKQEGKRPTLVRRRLSRTQALLGRVTAGGSVPMSGIKMRSLVGLSVRSAFHWLSCPVRRTYMVVVR